MQKREKSNSRGSYCWLSLLDSNHCYYHPICGYWVLLNSQAFKLQSPRPPGRVAISSSGVKVCGSEIRKKFPAWSVLELWDQNLCQVVVYLIGFFWLQSCLAVQGIPLSSVQNLCLPLCHVFSICRLWAEIEAHKRCFLALLVNHILSDWLIVEMNEVRVECHTQYWAKI